VNLAVLFATVRTGTAYQNFVKISLSHAGSVLILDTHTGTFLFSKITGN